jgi:hypothetical protein
MTTATEMKFDDLVNMAKVRHEDLNPVDRSSKLGRLRFALANPQEAIEMAKAGNAETFIPQWGLQSPGVAGFPDILELSPHAIRQFCSRSMLDYNQRLLERLPADSVFADMNYLLANDVGDKMSFLRMVHGSEDGSRATARAILGSRFTPLDDLELLSVARDYLQDAVVRFHGFSGMTSHFTASFPSESRSDGVEPGIHIANSEVGVRSVTIQAVLFRKICTNVLPRIDMMGDFGQSKSGNIYVRDGEGDHNMTGARRGTIEGGWRFIHTGSHERLSEFVKNAVEEATSADNPMLEMWDKGLGQRIDDPAKALERIAKLSQLGKDDHAAVVNAHTEEAAVSGLDFANSVTGIANAFTRAANAQEDSEKRYDFQMAGARTFSVFG